MSCSEFPLHFTYERSILGCVFLSGGGEEDDKPKCRVIINSTVVEVEVGPFNVRANFGDGAVLFDSSGQRVLTDEWGVTLHSLQHGASYYMVCVFFFL